MDADPSQQPAAAASQRQPTEQQRSRMNDLPDEIAHITQGFFPFSHLLTRLSQKTKNVIDDKVMELAAMPLPAPAMNGNSAHSHLDDDALNSPENLQKKKAYLDFLHDLHSQWVKALVIARWSRNARGVSTLIDLQFLIGQRKMLYDQTLDSLVNMKRNLHFARLPSPDLRTGLQVLSTGDAPWMPEEGYINPLPLESDQVDKFMEEINTHLSLRLNLEEHDKIPYHFRNYSVASGRVTFRVEGEFEVDLTIAEEEGESQFWFIDFRFIFFPAPEEISGDLLGYLEAKVNERLAADGLIGCYKFLHELVMTQKVKEFGRQAIELMRGRWIDSVSVEHLDRGLCIQYWKSRFPPKGPKSWLILGVHSGKTAQAPHPKDTSRLTIRWFRDGKEVKDAEFPVDYVNVSAESLLRTVIARHTQHTLTAMHDKLRTKARFTRPEAAMSLQISLSNPGESCLELQIAYGRSIQIKIEPVSGFFSIRPYDKVTWEGERQLNYNTNDPAEDGIAYLERIRLQHFHDEFNRCGKENGWQASPSSPLKQDELKSIVQLREPFSTLWMRRRGWAEYWVVMHCMSLGGDSWYLIELREKQASSRVKFFTPLSMTKESPNLSNTFFNTLTIYATGLIAQITDLRLLHKKHIPNSARRTDNQSLPQRLKMAGLTVRLADLLAFNNTAPKPRKKWARDMVQITFSGLQKINKRDAKTEGFSLHPVLDQTGANQTLTGMAKNYHIVAQARLVVGDKSKFSLLQGDLDRDVLFNHGKGQFLLRLRTVVGQSLIETLSSRLRALDNLVDFLHAMQEHRDDIQCETVTLRKIVFTYGDHETLPEEDSKDAVKSEVAKTRRWRAELDLSGTKNIGIRFEDGNPHTRLLGVVRNLLNTAEGFHLVPFLLSLTLPMVRALDEMEDSWAGIAERDQGSMSVHVRTGDWYAARWTLPAGPREDAPPRALTLNFQVRKRHGAFWWEVSRRPEEPRQDEFGRVLTAVWEGRGRRWNGLYAGAAALAHGAGVAAMMQELDKALKTLVGTPPPPPPPAPPPSASAVPAAVQNGGSSNGMPNGGGGLTPILPPSRRTPQMAQANMTPQQRLKQQQQQHAQDVNRPGNKSKTPIVLVD